MPLRSSGLASYIGYLCMLGESRGPLVTAVEVVSTELRALTLECHHYILSRQVEGKACLDTVEL